MFQATRRALLTATLIALPFAASAQSVPHEPEVTIIQQDSMKVEEYRVNGFLYAVRIVPDVGKPYFLVRAEGDDEHFYHSAKPELRIPSWQILTW